MKTFIFPLEGKKNESYFPSVLQEGKKGKISFFHREEKAYYYVNKKKFSFPAGHGGKEGG